jgi:hypothetical protein
MRLMSFPFLEAKGGFQKEVKCNQPAKDRDRQVEECAPGATEAAGLTV